MKKYVLLALLLTPLTLRAQSPIFTPFILSNQTLVNNGPYLAFPGSQGAGVLYWLAVASRYKEKTEVLSLTVTNTESQVDLKIQYATNQVEGNRQKNEGKIIGGIVGAFVLGISCGLVISDFKNPNNGLYLGLGAAFGAGSFFIGLAFDIGGHLRGIRFIGQ